MSERSIFIAALEQDDATERAAYLDRACAGDVLLRARIERLLKAHEPADSFLERGPAVLHATDNYEPIAERPGTVIGPHKLIEQIGEGGMGSVWMAQQTEPVRRLVAVKLIKAGMDSRQIIARFEAERQALALMDHPNIARVLDAGTSSAGRPYFVMDLVKGMPITRYCDEHHLTPRQRLELFIPVCHAVQHAHQKGVIHRDLKPSNVLVALYDGKPVPKIIDFGVAKAAGQQLTDKTLVTGFGAIVGTLEYMSPEQAEVNQLDIDTRSDVYSLGVLLYELLTGSPPFCHKELTQAGILEMLRVIREHEPSKPSTKLSTADGLPTLAANRGTEPAKLTKLVRGELDWIVMKALEKDRNRRYETADGFAMDVERYLADEPVLACPPSAGYRLRKFARRNKGGLAVAALVLFFLVLLGSGVGWVLRDRSAREAEAARQQEERHAKVAGEVESIFGEVDRLEKEQKWPEALEAARRAEAAAAGGEADPATAERVHQRRRDLEFIDRLERIRMEKATLVQGRFNYAGTDRDYARAFSEYGVDVDKLPVETSIGRLKARPALAVALAAALDDWVFVRRQVSNTEVARWKRLVAVACGIDSEPLRERVRAAWGQPIANVRDDLRRLAESIDVRAQHPATLFILTRTLGQVQHTSFALRILRDAQNLRPGDYWLNSALGSVLDEQEDHEGAVRFYTAAVASLPTSVGAHNNLGNALARQNKLDEAIACYRKAIETDPKYAYAYFNLGKRLEDQGKLDETIACFRKTAQLEPNFAAAQISLAWMLTTCREVKLRDAPGGLEAARRAVELERSRWAWQALGWAHYRTGDWKASIEALEKSCAMDDPKGGDAAQWFFLAMAHWRLGEKDTGREWYDRAVQWMDKNQPKEELLRRFRAEASELLELKDYFNLGRALEGQGKPVEPIAAFEEVIRGQPDNALAHFGRASALAKAQQWDRSARVYAAALKRFGAPLMPGPWYEAIRSDEVFTRLTAQQPDDRLPWIMRARLHVLERDWKRAAADYARLYESRASIDPAKLLPEFDDLFGYGCLLLLLGDRHGYEQFCKKWADRVGDSPAWGYSLARAWAVSARPVVPAQQIVERAGKALQADRAPWIIHVLSLAHYRNGEFELAIERALESNGDWPRSSAKALNWLVLAMAHSRLGHAADARQSLQQALELTGQACLEELPGVEWPDIAPPDVVELELLRLEAEELINPKSNEKPDKKSG